MIDKADTVIDTLPADAFVCNLPSGVRYLVLRRDEPPMVVFTDGTFLTYIPPWWRKNGRQESEAE